jgi:sugar phosphate isomerase/epimerase
VQKLATLRDAGYEGYYSVEHHTGKNEYTEVAIQIARVRDVLERWRIGE